MRLGSLQRLVPARQWRETRGSPCQRLTARGHTWGERRYCKRLIKFAQTPGDQLAILRQIIIPFLRDYKTYVLNGGEAPAKLIMRYRKGSSFPPPQEAVGNAPLVR